MAGGNKAGGRRCAFAASAKLMDEHVSRTDASRAPLPPRNEFDEDAYLQLHPDVAAAVSAGVAGSAWQHFTLHGFAEGRQWMAKPDPLVGVSREISPGDEMFYGNELHYFDVGESALHCIEAALFAARRRSSSIEKILDLPCGHGRVMRFLKKAFPEARLTACDLNRDGVEYCAHTFGATPVFSRVEPDDIPLREECDLIWCGSLLTHLSEEKCAAFLRLFQRLLKPGGIAIFTTHGRHYERELAMGKNGNGLDDRQISALLDDYRRWGFGYVDYASQAGYGFSLALPSFVLGNFVQRPEWRLIAFHESGWDKRQDVISVQRSFSAAV